MFKDFKQFNIQKSEKKLEDFFEIQGNTLNLRGTLQTPNFIAGKRGVRIENDGLNASTISGDLGTTTISGALQHTGSSVGFYGTSPIAKQTVTLGNTNGEIGGLTIGGTYSQGEVQALRDKCEELADDVRNLKSALAALGLMN